MQSTVVLLELGGVLFALGVLGRLAALAGMSPIPLYLLAGLAFGRGGLLPLDATEEFIEVGAEIGVILLLLSLGLEYTPDELTGSLRANVPAGILDLVLNATPGAVVALMLGWQPVAVVAMAGVTWVTSSGIVAKLLRDLGRLGNRETPVVLSLLVVEDLAMALYLPLLTALLAGVGLLTGSLTVVVAVAVVGLVLLAAIRYGGLISRLVFVPNDEVLLLRILGLALLVAGIAQQLQVSAGVGAFLLGIAVSGEAAESARALLSPLRDLFAAVFFVFFGLQTDPSELPPVLLAALGLAAVTVLTKVVTGWWAARRAGIGRAGRLRAGLTLVARGEFSIVIAGLAVAAGTEPALGPLAASYVLVMAVAGPVLTRLADPLTGRLRRREAAAHPTAPATRTLMTSPR